MNNTSHGRGYGAAYGGRPSYGGFRSNQPKPIEGQEYSVTITETSRSGDGVAKIDGFVIFVSGGQRGEQARIRITQVAPRFANGEKVKAKEEPRPES